MSVARERANRHQPALRRYRRVSPEKRHRGSWWWEGVQDLDPRRSADGAEAWGALAPGLSASSSWHPVRSGNLHSGGDGWHSSRFKPACARFEARPWFRVSADRARRAPLHAVAGDARGHEVGLVGRAGDGRSARPLTSPATLASQVATGLKWL